MIDFHVHTIYSDGTFSPLQLIEHALNSGVTTISITDHDTSSAFIQEKQLISESRLQIIPGLELSSNLGDKKVHMLGYGLDPEAPSFQEFLAGVRAERVIRISRMAELLRKEGFDVSQEDLDSVGTDIKGRAHLARILVAKGYLKSEEEAFAKYLTPGKPAYCSYGSLDVPTAIEQIHAAGGVAVVAHAFTSHLTDEDLNSIIESGVDGIEVFYPNHTLPFREYLISKAEGASLLITGGTDFHGVKNGSVMPIGVVGYPEKYLKTFLERLQYEFK